MQITHVVRGDEHFMNGIKQICMFRAFGKEPPQYAHIPLILGKDGKKLSKRYAQTNLLDYKAQGYPSGGDVQLHRAAGLGLLRGSGRVHP